MRRLIWILPLFLLPLAAAAYSRPGSPQGYVSDFANVLQPAVKQSLEDKLAAFEKQSGNELAVVTVQSLGGDTIENYAVSLFADWGIGQKGKDNGVLLLVAPNEHDVRIEVGYGLEGALTDAQSYWIIQNQILPAFRQGDYAGGINSGVDKIIAALGGENIPSEEPQQSGGGGMSSDTWFFLIFIVPIWLASILARSKSWWLGGVLGGVGGIIVGLFYGFLWTGIASILGLSAFGLWLDFVVSRAYARGKATGHFPWWIGGGRGFGGGGGGFGGFGGGMSGGGGSSGHW